MAKAAPSLSIGVDIGGTKVAAGVVDEVILDRWQEPTRHTARKRSRTRSSVPSSTFVAGTESRRWALVLRAGWTAIKPWSGFPRTLAVRAAQGSGYRPC